MTLMNDGTTYSSDEPIVTTAPRPHLCDADGLRWLAPRCHCGTGEGKGDSREGDRRRDRDFVGLLVARKTDRTAEHWRHRMSLITE